MKNLPIIGQGLGQYSWNTSHVDVIQYGISKGFTLLDTAEEYDHGQSEVVAGRAIRGMRDQVLVATKFSPQHSRYSDILDACDESLRRLDTDYIDIYQMHWPNPEILSFPDGAAEAMKRLVLDGKVRSLGVCNVSPRQLVWWKEALGNDLQFVQMEYNLFDRTIEEGILPLCEEYDLKLLAYTPLDGGRIPESLSWLITRPRVIPIPKTARKDRMDWMETIIQFPASRGEAVSLEEGFYTPVQMILPSSFDTTKIRIDDTFVPSPERLARYLEGDPYIKPVRARKMENGKYELLEGRLRFLAWVLAFGVYSPIRTLLRKS